MSSNGYIGMVFYDISVLDLKMRKKYDKFRKNLLRKGFYQLQESVYICKYNYKATINLHLEELRMLAPKEANVRMLILTQVQFNAMEVIAGEKNFYENILTQDNLILEL